MYKIILSRLKKPRKSLKWDNKTMGMMESAMLLSGKKKVAEVIGERSTKVQGTIAQKTAPAIPVVGSDSLAVST